MPTQDEGVHGDDKISGREVPGRVSAAAWEVGRMHSHGGTVRKVIHLQPLLEEDMRGSPETPEHASHPVDIRQLRGEGEVMRLENYIACPPIYRPATTLPSSNLSAPRDDGP